MLGIVSFWGHALAASLFAALALWQLRRWDRDVHSRWLGAALAVTAAWALSVALLALSGAVDMVSVNIRSLLLQLLVPDRLLGRVSSVNQIFIGSSNEIGAFESGVAARIFGAARATAEGGTLTVVAATGDDREALRWASTRLVLEGRGESGTLAAERLE